MGLREIIDEAIENELQKQVDLFEFSMQTIIELGAGVEILFSQGLYMEGSKYLPALQLIIDKLKAKEYKMNGKSQELLSYYALLNVATDYYVLRDYIYYSYAVEESIEWENRDNTIFVKVNDKSIFRQLVNNIQSVFLSSSKVPESNIMLIDELLTVLKDKDEFDLSNEEMKRVLNSIEQEAEMKMKSYFSYIPMDSKISFGKYTYSDFIKVYKHLLVQALYRRYYSFANNLPSILIFDSQELNDEISQSLKIKKEISICILMDIAQSSIGTFNYIKQEDSFVMYLTCFSLLDGITYMLKHYARENTDGFLTNFAGPIGEALVSDVEKSFCKYENFRCIKDKKLNKYSQSLPDIDLLAISYEPSLGFHFFVCEIKNVLLPTWAKEYLKASGKKGYITKALTQINHIEEFFKTEDGQKMLFDIVNEKFSFMDFKKIFPRGFCILIDFIIITSENIGVLCDDNNKSIVSAFMMKEIIDKSDGDVTYIHACLKNLDKAIDECLEIVNIETRINGNNVNYEACSSNKLLKFAKNSYIGDGTYKELENCAIEIGYSFVDEIELPKTENE